jgi:NADH-quinone oxidoreductase subunit G
MPRKQPKMITFTIDGRDVQAPENTMLVDAAKHGDVEIPYFCYEPKLGQPVGACRMCLVEIEGIPKLQTGCSTAVKDGMVVYTETEAVKTAQRGVVEFLLVNHPLDCPVCDKGGECPLQDISFGWGAGISRVIEPKRHFVKPLELSPTIAIDRERCILCYRCARFSQEVSEDHQVVLVQRGAQSYISTFDAHPYVAPFSGNIIELCPVGALTSIPYRFRARPWDIEDSGSVCTLCPAQCNVAFTVRDDRVMRVLAREHPEVNDAWLCDKGRFAYQSIHVEQRLTQPLLRDGGALRPVSWERALEEAQRALARARGRVGALAGAGASSEEGLALAALMRDALASEHVDTLASIDPRKLHRLAAPQWQARVSDLEHAHTVLVVGTEPVDDIPILDLRIRKGVRREGVKLLIASAHRSALDPRSARCVRYAPQRDAAFLHALALALEMSPAGEPGSSPQSSAPERGKKNATAAPGAAPGDELARAARIAGVQRGTVVELAELLRSGGEDVVILYGQRLLAAPGPGTDALLRIARALSLDSRPGDGSEARGLLGVPADGLSNARGLLEAGVAPGYGPGYERRETGNAPALGALAIGQALAEGELDALYLLQADPLRSSLPRERFERALARANVVIAHAEFLTEGVREYADVVFPAESYAEKEGTVVHPDGRLQRLRPAIGRQGATRAGWWVIAELARRLGHDMGLVTEPPGEAARAALAAAGIVAAGLSASAVSERLFAAAPIYSGLTPDEIGGRGVRWQERPAAQSFPAPPSGPLDEPLPEPPPAPTERGAALGERSGEEAAAVELATAPAAAPANGHRSFWDAPEVEFSPALRVLYREHARVARERRS